MGEEREQNQTYPCQKPFQNAVCLCLFFGFFFVCVCFGSYADRVALPSQTCHFPLLPCPGWGCSGHAQTHCCPFWFVFFFLKKRVDFSGRENILRPLALLRQHAVAYNRIIALGTDGAKDTLCGLEEYSYGSGVGARGEEKET